MKYLLAVILFLAGCFHYPAPVLAQSHGAMVNPHGTAHDVRVRIHEMYNMSRLRLVRYPVVGLGIEQMSIWQYSQFLDAEINKFEAIASVCNEIPVKLIFDIHHPIGGIRAGGRYGYHTFVFEDESLKSEFVEQWKYIAARFKGNKCVLGYDIMNEPTTTRRKWKSLVKQVVKEIRKIDKRKKIIVESVLGDPNKISTFPIFKNRLKKNLWYSAHIYYPAKIAFMGLPDPANDYQIKYSMKKIRYTKEKLYKYVSKLRRFQQEHNVPIYIGEFGAAAWAIDGNKLIRDWLRIFREYNWKWSYHSWDEWGIWSPYRAPVQCPNPHDISFGHCQLPFDDTRAKLLKRFA